MNIAFIKNGYSKDNYNIENKLKQNHLRELHFSQHYTPSAFIYIYGALELLHLHIWVSCASWLLLLSVANLALHLEVSSHLS